MKSWGLRGGGERVLARDATPLDVREEGLVEGLHPVEAPSAMMLGSSAVSSGFMIASRTRPVVRRISSAATRPPSSDGTSRCEMTPRSERGEHRAHLAVLVGREEVDDAVDRLGSVGGVQRREDQVAGLGGGEGGAAPSPRRASRR